MVKRVHVTDCHTHNAANDGSAINLAKAVTENKIGEEGWLQTQYSYSAWGRQKAIELFERDLNWLLDEDSNLRRELKTMNDTRIACMCPNHMDCHVDVIVQKIEELQKE